MIEEKYRIVRELGRGGEGQVYLVQHKLTEQLRAAKVLKNVPGSRRFQEINAMKRLEHLGLPQIYDVIEEEERIWLIMEYVRGKCLHEIPGEAVCGSQFFAIARQLSEILVYLHTRPAPVFHFDIKPSNLLLKEDGTLVLIDFGAAVRQKSGVRQKGSEASAEEVMDCFGTPGFAAPEQFQRGAADGRSDIYGAGAVLYFYLFRTTPDKGGRDPETVRYKLMRNKRVRTRSVAAILLQCLCVDPSGRFQDAKAFRKAVIRAERRYIWGRKARGIVAAVSFLGLVITFAWYQLTAEFSKEKVQIEVQQEKQYQELLNRADRLGFEQAVSCYQEAMNLSGGDENWIFRLLERIMGDYSFNTEEEMALKQLLFQVDKSEEQTVVEKLQISSERFGELAYKIGLAYWHYYEGTGGKRAAADWFSQALDVAEESLKQGKTAEEWFERVQIYVKISAYYEKLGRTDENGIQLAGVLTYWEDLKQLWQIEGRKEQSLAIQRQLAEELLSCLVLQTHELKEGEKNREELEQVLAEVENFVQENYLEDLEKICISAKEAVKRVYERRKE